MSLVNRNTKAPVMNRGSMLVLDTASEAIPE
jgi:hypothetical protein